MIRVGNTVSPRLEVTCSSLMGISSKQQNHKKPGWKLRLPNHPWNISTLKRKDILSQKKGKGRALEIHAKIQELERVLQAFIAYWLVGEFEKNKSLRTSREAPNLHEFIETASLPPFLWLFQFNILLWKQML